MLSPLANPVYARLFTAQVIALVGTGLTTVALALLAYSLAGGAAGEVLGTALAIKMIAYVTLAPLFGAVAHRIPRRTMLILLDVARAGFVVCLPFVTEVWQVYLLIFLMQACSAGFTPTFQATIPDVLKDEAEYTKALSLSRLAYDLENLLSPALAAAALLILSFDTLFAANAVAFMVSAGLVYTTPLPSPSAPPPSGTILSRLGFGIAAYFATPRLRGLLAFSMATAAAGAMVIVNTVVYARSVLGLGETETAVMLAAFGAGSMTAALALPRILAALADRSVMTAGAALATAGLGLMSLAPPYLAALPVWFLAGLGYAAMQLPSGRLLRRSANDTNRPALFSAQFALSHACWLVTYPLAGWLGHAAGLGTTAMVLASIALAATGLALWLWPASDPDEVEHTHPALLHTHLHIHDEHHQHEHEGWEGPEPHTHAHAHAPLRHRHVFVIDDHHPQWPAHSR